MSDDKALEELDGLLQAASGQSVEQPLLTAIGKRSRSLESLQPDLRKKHPSVHSKLESTVRYLGIEVDDVLEIFEQTEI